MRKIQIDYCEHICEQMRKIAYEEYDNIEKATSYLCECKKQNKTTYFFGTGHSYIISQEIFARAGGYGKFIPILQDELCMNHAFKSTLIERTAEYASVIEGLYDFQEGDIIIMTSNSGRNRLIIELALRLRQKGVKIIAITSLEAAKESKSRHESGYLLYQLADVVLDNHSVIGDAYIKHSETVITGPTSTILGCYIVQLLISCFINREVESGNEVSVFMSSNVDCGDTHNKDLFAYYKKM